MPVVESTYQPPFWAKNGYVSTVYSGLFRKVGGLEQSRTRIYLSDGDFLDLDWSHANQPTGKLIILLHGLEGTAQRPYITSAAKLFNQNGFDAVAVNFRSCSGEPNLLYRSYHSGATEDLKEVLDHLVALEQYERMYINGFSLGGNMALKYLGEGNVIPKELKGVVAISVPCDLNGSCYELHKLKNKPYAMRFLDHLKGKLLQKQQQFPQRISKEDIDSIKLLIDFDNVYTSKAHGFRDALDYYEKCSSLQFLSAIEIPTLIINALNDSFLSHGCYPVKEAKANSHLFLEMPKYGGHVGFKSKQAFYYNELRALDFITSI